MEETRSFRYRQLLSCKCFKMRKASRVVTQFYAKKLKPSDTERREMNATNVVIPKTKKNNKLDFYKRNIHKIVKRPFNSDKWSAF